MVRGFIEPRSLATTLARSRGPYIRSYSAGRGGAVGRGRGFSENADDSLFSGGAAGYGHGSPLNFNRAANPSAGSQEAGSPNIGTAASSGRGLSALSSGPILPNFSVGRGVLQRPTDDGDRAPPPPTFSLGLRGLGRGKPAQTQAPGADETAFLDESRRVLPKWEEKMKKIDDTEGVSAAELRLLGNDTSSGSIKFPSSPGSMQQVKLDKGQSVSGKPPTFSVHPSSPDLQRGGGSSFLQSQYGMPGSPPRTSASQSPSPPRSPDVQRGLQGPVQQFQEGIRPSLVTPQITGSPFLQKGGQQGGQPSPLQSHYNPTPQAWSPQPRLPPPQTASMSQPSWSQPASMSQPPQPQPTTHIPYQSSPSQYPMFEQPPTTASFKSFYQEVEQPATSELGLMDSQGGWELDESSGQAVDSSQYFDQQDLGADAYVEGINWDSQSPVLDTTPVSHVTNANSTANNYEYDWGAPIPEELVVETSQTDVTSSMEEVRVDYNAKIEECFTQGNLEDIDVVYTEMKAASIQASAKTYDTLMQVYMKLGKMDKISQVYQDMRNVLLEDGKGKLKDKVTMEMAAPVSKSMDGSGKPAVKLVSSHQAERVMNRKVSNFIDDGEVRDSVRQSGGPLLSEEENLRMSFKETVSLEHLDVSQQALSPSERPESPPGLGMGRGKKPERIFDFNFSEPVPTAPGLGLGRGKLLPGEDAKSEKYDDYSETFRPVLKPEWQYAFAPQGVSVGPGAGRGRPLSAQTPDMGLGASNAFSPQGFDSSVGRGRRLSPQLMDRPQSGTYRRDTATGAQFEEPTHPTLSQEEAGVRAMKILNSRGKNRMAMMEEWSRDDDEDDDNRRRRTSVWDTVPRVPRERRQPRKSRLKQDVERLIDEEEKEDIERLKAMAKNEAIEEIKKSLADFMKCYGEIACEPEHLMVFTNPDIHEKPLPPLSEYLELAKPNIMKTGLVRSEKEWQRMVKDVLKDAPYYENLVERHGGPGRYTAKQENEDLESIAGMLPSDVKPDIKSSLNRHLTTLKNNPGFNLDEKQWMLANLVDEMSR